VRDARGDAQGPAELQMRNPGLDDLTYIDHAVNRLAVA
jgi:hypothetical protein